MGQTMKPTLPIYCHWITTNGRRYIRFKKGNFATNLRGHPGSPEFTHLYELALKGIKIPRPSLADEFWNYVDRTPKADDCWPWTRYIDREGYGRAVARKPGQSPLAHRHAWILSRGSIPKGSHVLHSCDNPACCNPAHLFLGTHQDNMKDRNKKRRFYAKLTEDDVRKIRRAHESGLSQTQLAKAFGTTPSNISLICNKINWRNI